MRSRWYPRSRRMVAGVKSIGQICGCPGLNGSHNPWRPPSKSPCHGKEANLGDWQGLTQGQSPGHTKGQLGQRPPRILLVSPPLGGMITTPILLRKVLLYASRVVGTLPQPCPMHQFGCKLYSHPIYGDIVIGFWCTLPFKDIRSRY